jgi:FtsH-binding integral membrane protein
MKNLLNTNIFKNHSRSEISDRTFMGSIAGFISYGLIITYLMAAFVAPPMPSIWFLLGVGVLLPILGIFVSQSDNLGISFIGYNLIVAPIGLCLGPVANFVDPSLVQDAALITGLITGLMGFAGVTFPNLFKNLGGVLFYSLIGLLVVRIFQMFIPALAGLTIIDYIAAGIFSLYIGYDMYRASTIGRTYHNALQVSISLYLDIINLFLNILSILGSDND